MEGERRTEAGRWWRFSQYEIRDGAIQPAEGATLEQYDPWAEYEVSRQKGSGGAEPPYQSLARLVQQASFTVGGDLRPESEEAVLDWCRRYGLLGIVPQYAEAIPVCQIEDVPPEEEPHGWLAHVWLGGTWRQVYVTDRLIEEQGRMFHRFPSCPQRPRGDNANAPNPETPEYWQEYGEPVRELLQVAKVLAESLDSISALTALDISRESHFETETAAGVSFTIGLDLINSLTASVSPIMEVVADGDHAVLRERWAFRSLLASMAMMIHRDLVRGARAYVCKNCGTPFTSSSPKAGYCSLTCRNSAQKRRQRERWQAQGKKVV